MGLGEGEADLGGLFEDLEQQAAGIHYAERDAELLDRARGEYAAVTFASRVHASLGRRVTLGLADGSAVEGTLVRAGVDWCALAHAEAEGEWLVRLGAVTTARGLSPRAVPEATRPAVARLGFGSALHRLSAEGDSVVLHLVTTRRDRVRVVRIGADFLEADPVDSADPGSSRSSADSGGPVGSAVLVPFAAVLAVRRG